MLRFAAAALLAALPVAPACAQAVAPAVAAPDPARLAAAQALLARFLPPERRDAMVDQMIRPMIENMRGAMTSDASFAALRSEDAAFGEAFDQFIHGELEHSLAATKAAMPALIDAMARAYARRFTLEQLAAITAFFETPAGRAFAEQSPTILSDPDILAVQRKMMTEAMAGMQKRIEAFAAKAAAQSKKPD
ncbi:DUF2059 domain-containing protein [Sphingomonas sp. HF-S4]|uniref:DUF2059 domain-containing protein n=1 Tax=Sphingomonas agrestis TaxID=3080540 RepID=A0ABU3YC07_9SPHN|nr:DUF2059 domain-containing protein [Sphingomonas sp. HF-S4]MDV3458849.1 DUF2059 domain-containing protein [Sphingomonas sp. HF-S4]